MKLEDINKAFEYARMKHAGQLRRGGKDYITHPIRVSEKVADEYKVVALLHDVIEDTDATLDDIERLFGEAVRCSVDCLTHRVGENYEDYIKRVLTDKIAIGVKIHDILDNLGDSPSVNAINKGTEALKILLLSRI